MSKIDKVFFIAGAAIIFVILYPFKPHDLMVMSWKQVMKRVKGA